jgi:hypothetical protein
MYDQFMNQDPAMMYAQLSPNQRAAIAQQFMQEYQQWGDPAAQQFASFDPNQVTPEQLAAMHLHARERNPGLLGRVMEHPIAAAALGGFAAYEIDKHVRNRERERQQGW